MDAERFAIVKGILVTLDSTPPAERAAYLDRACGGDAALRAEIESLLGNTTPGILRTGGLADRIAPMVAPDRVAVGGRIGPYKLTGVLGEGGMGVVYQAEQTAPIHREVALKLIPAGMDSARVLARFESERQAIAMMNHPYIAQAFEAGAGDDGRPYVVMELVRGEPVTDYCAREKPPLGDRLKLFLRICDAIQHAHQRGIIHRDLKPSNVLLARQGSELLPKIIDFGIAKAFGESRSPQFLSTIAGQTLGTPEYMSPEQAGIIDAGLDTRTDVYSLGVILYEIISGRRPYELEKRTSIELERALRTPPPAPGLGDIDAVALMAMERQPDDRYASVEQLADDVRRVLDRRPVRARTQTWRYRAGRFVRRNAASVATAALILVLILAGTIGIVAQRNLAIASEARAVSEAARARAEADKASAVAGFLTDLFREADPANARGATVTARELLDRGAKRVSSELGSQEAVRATLMDTIGVVYRMLGVTVEAEKMATDALAIRRGLAEDSLDIAQSLEHLGHLARDRTQYEKAAGFHRDALEMRRRLLPPRDAAIAESLTSLAQDLRELGKYDEAAAIVDEAIAIRRETLGPDHSDTLTSLKVLGDVRDSSGKFADAERLYTEVLEARRRLLPADHPLIAGAMVDLAGVVSREGRYEDAEAMFREALAIREKVLAPDHPDVTTTKVSLSRTLRNQGRLDEAEPIVRDALAADRRHFGNQHMNVAVTLNYLASILQDRRKFPEAAKVYEESLAIRIALVGEVHPLVAVVYHNMGHLRLKQGALDEAERSFRRAIAVRNQLGQQTHRQTGETIMQLGRVLEARGRFADAEQEYNIALKIQRAASPAGSPSTADVLESLGYLMVRQKKPATGEPLIREALEFRRKSLPAGHRTIALDETDLGECLIAQSKWAEAETLLHSALKSLPEPAIPAGSLRERVLGLLVKLYESTGKPDEAARYRFKN